MLKDKPTLLSTERYSRAILLQAKRQIEWSSSLPRRDPHVTVRICSRCGCWNANNYKVSDPERVQLDFSLMETPVREQVRGMRRKYTSEEKKQLLANLDLEGSLVIVSSCFLILTPGMLVWWMV